MTTIDLQLPTPWEVSYIRPEIMVYRRDLKPFSITYDVNVNTAIDQLKSGGFLSTKRIIFIAHGFQNNINTKWLHEMKDELLKESDQSVALVGWGRGADVLPIRYRQSAANLESVGVWLAGYAAEINRTIGGLEIWGIGHSLGAHLIGIAGRNSCAFSRISGLDPAGPCFEKHEDSKQLRKTDAGIVDVIHTDGYDQWYDPKDWVSPVNHYGTLIPLGTIDFYPNYGYHQPGAGDFTIAGSHNRSIDLFTWSISNPGRFKTFEVLDGTPEFEKPVKKLKRDLVCAEMGFYANTSHHSSGLYYVETNSSSPWK